MYNKILQSPSVLLRERPPHGSPLPHAVEADALSTVLPHVHGHCATRGDLHYLWRREDFCRGAIAIIPYFSALQQIQRSQAIVWLRAAMQL